MQIPLGQHIAPAFFLHLFCVNVQPNLYLVVTWYRLIALRAGDDCRLAAARLAETLAQVHLDCQDLALGSHFDIFHIISPIRFIVLCALPFYSRKKA